MRVLIYMEISQLRPVGGPLGYVNNLKDEVINHKDSCVDFLTTEKGYRKYKKIFNIDNWRYFKGFAKSLKLFAKHYDLEYGSKHKALVDLKQYDMVHFHSTLDMYSVRDSLSDYNGKVILTSHSPTLLSKELYDNLSFWDKVFGAFVYKKLYNMDSYGFNRADYFIFPCPEAEEPYYHAWSEYKDLKTEKKDRFYYLPTGIKPCIAKVQRNEIRGKYKIPQDAFLICYVGRHNKIKGYDLLKEILKPFIDQKKVYVIVAGRENPMKGLDHPNWIEIGWTKDPHSIVSSSDLFILPNRETYFDLVLLEVLSLGKIVVASSTGGNKYFRNTSSVFLYDTIKESQVLIDNILQMPISERKVLERSSLELFNQSFTCGRFYQNYMDILGKIYQASK